MSKTIEEKLRESEGLKPVEPQAPQLPQGQEVVKVVYTSIGKDVSKSSKNWGDMTVDIENTFKVMVQDLMFGKPVIVSNETVEDIDQFVRELKLQVKLYAAEGVAFTSGRAFLSITKTPAGKVSISLANPSFPNRVIYMGDVIIGAEIWEVVQTDRAPYYMRTTYTSTKIERTVFDGFEKGRKDVGMDVLKRSSIPEALIPAKEEPNKLKFIPVEPIYFREPINYSDSAVEEVRGMYSIDGVQNFYDELSFAMRREAFNNATKVLLDEGMMDQYSEDEIRELRRSDWMFALEGTGDSEGSGKKVEIMMGDPKLDQYQKAMTGLLATAAEVIKVSTLGIETGSSSATEAIFTKANDVETTNTLKVMRSQVISRLLEKALLTKNDTPTNEWEVDETNWSVVINPNIIMNEAKLTETLKMQYEMGAIDLPTVVSELKGISVEDAKEKLQAHDDSFDKEMEEEGEGDDSLGEDNDASDKNISGGK